MMKEARLLIKIKKPKTVFLNLKRPIKLNKINSAKKTLRNRLETKRILELLKGYTSKVFSIKA